MKKIAITAAVIASIVLLSLLGYIMIFQPQISQKPQTPQTPEESPQVPEKTEEALTPQEVLEMVYNSIESPVKFWKVENGWYLPIHNIELEKFEGKEIKITGKIRKYELKGLEIWIEEYYFYAFDPKKSWSYETYLIGGKQTIEIQGFGIKIQLTFTSGTVWEPAELQSHPGWKKVIIEGEISSVTLHKSRRYTPYISEKDGYWATMIVKVSRVTQIE